MQIYSATSKAEASARAYLLAGDAVEPLGPGSKEKRSVLVAIGKTVQVDVSGVPGKVEACRKLAAELGVVWDDACYSRGDTITLTGLNRLVDAATRRALDQGVLSPTELTTLVATARATPSTQNGTTDRMPANLTDIEQNVAEQLAELSRTTPAPDGVTLSPESFAPDDVRFDDGSWRARLTDVQGWLRLPSELDERDSESFDESLADGLGVDPASLGRHDTTLIARLAERLDKATALRQRFLEDLEAADEGAVTLASATKRWVDAWDEVEEEEEAEFGGPIQAAATTWPITEFVQRASTRKLDLSPSYQRADVWPTSAAQMLIESVLRGIPLPSVIILQKKDADERITFEVVDGKQRLTSILRFIGKHPRAVDVVQRKAEEWGEPHALQLFQDDYPAFKKLWKQHETRRLNAELEKQLHFPFPLRAGEVRALSGDLASLRGRYYCEIKDRLVDVVGERWEVSTVFEQQSDYKLPVIVYKQVTTEQIHEVFSLYNKQGKHLNAEEIRNALFHHLDLMRALLVTAGDADDLESVAPFLAPHWGDLSSTPRTLDTYGFGRAGYKRTKLLSWVASVLFGEDSNVGSKSTASTVNSLFRRIDEQRSDVLRDRRAVAEAMLLLDHGLDAHAAIEDDVWAPSFRNSQGKGGWQELQLVASLIALSAAAAVHEDLETVLEDKESRIAEASEGWTRPKKTQSGDQWRFIAEVVREFLAVLDVDVDDADERLRARFGRSGLAALVRLPPRAD